MRFTYAAKTAVPLAVILSWQPALAAEPPTELAPYIGKTCTGKVGQGTNQDMIVVNADNTLAVHHKYTTSPTDIHDAGLRPLTKGDDGWWHFTSDSGAEHSLRPKDASHLTVQVRISHYGQPWPPVDYECIP